MLLRWTLSLILCGLIIWSISLPPTTTAPVVKLHDDESVDYFIENIELTSLNSEGDIDYQLTSQMLFHHKNSEEVIFETPDIFIYNDKKLKWQVNAKLGKGDLSGNQLILSEDVLMTDFTTKPQTQLSTDEALIDRAEQEIHSQHDVLVTMGLNKVQATGLHVDLPSGIVSLDENVSAIFNEESTNVQY